MSFGKSSTLQRYYSPRSGFFFSALLFALLSCAPPSSLALTFDSYPGPPYGYGTHQAARHNNGDPVICYGDADCFNKATQLLNYHAGGRAGHCTFQSFPPTTNGNVFLHSPGSAETGQSGECRKPDGDLINDIYTYVSIVYYDCNSGFSPDTSAGLPGCYPGGDSGGGQGANCPPVGATSLMSFSGETLPDPTCYQNCEYTTSSQGSIQFGTGGAIYGSAYIVSTAQYCAENTPGLSQAPPPTGVANGASPCYFAFNDSGDLLFCGQPTPSTTGCTAIYGALLCGSSAPNSSRPGAGSIEPYGTYSAGGESGDLYTQNQVQQGSSSSGGSSGSGSSSGSGTGDEEGDGEGIAQHLGGGASCDSPPTFDRADGTSETALQAWRTRCAIERGQEEERQRLEDLEDALQNVTTVEASFSDLIPGFAARSCNLQPVSISLAVVGRSVEIPFDKFCGPLQAVGVFVYISSILGALRIAFS